MSAVTMKGLQTGTRLCLSHGTSIPGKGKKPTYLEKNKEKSGCLYFHFKHTE